jgi:negative regulator of sigma E activity
MRRLILPGIGLALVLVLGPAVAQEPDPKALIEEAIKAHGGEAVLLKLQTARTKGSGSVEVMGLNIKFTSETVQTPTKHKTRMVMDAFGQKIEITEVFDGEKAWLMMPDKVLDLKDEKLKAMKDSAHASTVETLVPLLKDKQFTLEALQEEKVNDKPAVGVRVKAKDQRDVDLWFDKASHLVVKVSRISYDSDAEKDAPYEAIVTEYKDFGGIKHASKVQVNKDGKKFMSLEITDVKPVDKVDGKEFARPL